MIIRTLHAYYGILWSGIIEEEKGIGKREPPLMGRILIISGVVLAGIGVLVTFAERLPIKLGRLPGDIRIESKNGSFYFPIVTCLLLSALVSLVMWLADRR